MSISQENSISVRIIFICMAGSFISFFKNFISFFNWGASICKLPLPFSD